MVALQQAAVDAGFVVEAVQMGRGDQLEQVSVSLDVPGQHGQVVGALFGRAAALVVFAGHVHLAADDGLDAGGGARLIEVDRSVHHPVVGYRKRVHPQLGRLATRGFMPHSPSRRLYSVWTCR